jgi:hypothetical protein
VIAEGWLCQEACEISISPMSWLWSASKFIIAYLNVLGVTKLTREIS